MKVENQAGWMAIRCWDRLIYDLSNFGVKNRFLFPENAQKSRFLFPESPKSDFFFLKVQKVISFS
jgi:hypothetical protein